MSNRLLNRALEVIAAVHGQADRLNLAVSVVCVDRGGRLVAMRRCDLAGYPTVEVARRKAATAAVMGMPTAMIVGFVAGDPLAALALSAGPDMLAVPGGAPLLLDDMVQGGIGVAGGHYSEDQALLDDALAALADAALAKLARAR